MNRAGPTDIHSGVTGEQQRRTVEEEPISRTHSVNTMSVSMPLYGLSAFGKFALQLAFGAAVKGAQNSLAKKILSQMVTKVSMIKFAGRAKSTTQLIATNFCCFGCRLFRHLLLRGIAFYFRATRGPQCFLLLPPGAENPSYATGRQPAPPRRSPGNSCCCCGCPGGRDGEMTGDEAPVRPVDAVGGCVEARIGK